MNKKIPLGIAISVVALVATLAIMLTYTLAISTFEDRMSSVTERQNTYDLMSEIEGKIRQKFYGNIDEATLREAMAAGMLDGLNDENCAYLSPEQWELQSNRDAGYDFGFGMDISRASDGNILINRVTAGSPAASAGLVKGDVIIYVDGVTVLSTGYDKAAKKLADATSIGIKIRRGSLEISYTITKAKFDIVSVEYRSMANVGYIRIYKFDNKTPDQFNAAYNSLKHAGINALIIDLRDNDGGSYEHACKILDTVLPQGNLMTFIDASGESRVLYSSDARCIDVPICILINENTAAAAEMFASAVYDYGRCKLVGTSTKGQLTVQETFALSNGAAITLTTGEWRTDRCSAVANGVLVPGFEVKFTSYQQENRFVLSDEEDPQIQTAIELLQSDIASQQPVAPVVSGTDTAG